MPSRRGKRPIRRKGNFFCQAVRLHVAFPLHSHNRNKTVQVLPRTPTFNEQQDASSPGTPSRRRRLLVLVSRVRVSRRGVLGGCRRTDTEFPAGSLHEAGKVPLHQLMSDLEKMEKEEAPKEASSPLMESVMVDAHHLPASSVGKESLRYSLLVPGLTPRSTQTARRRWASTAPRTFGRSSTSPSSACCWRGSGEPREATRTPPCPFREMHVFQIETRRCVSVRYKWLAKDGRKEVRED